MFGKTPPATLGATPLVPPPDADIALVLARLRDPNALCFAQVAINNQGVAVGLSFRLAKVEVGSGTLEVALRQAAIDVTSSVPAGDWSWNEEFLKMVAAAETTTRERVRTANEVAAMTRTQQEDLKGEAEVKGKGVLVEALARLSSTRTDKREGKRESTRGGSEKSFAVVSTLQIHRGPQSYSIEFDAGPHENLVALNPNLARMSLLDVPEPSSVKAANVKMDLRLRLAQDVDSVSHAFHIKHATDDWAPLNASANRRILGELLLSKFLRPLHEPQRLWPTGEDLA